MKQSAGEIEAGLRITAKSVMGEERTKIVGFAMKLHQGRASFPKGHHFGLSQIFWLCVSSSILLERLRPPLDFGPLVQIRGVESYEGTPHPLRRAIWGAVH